MLYAELAHERPLMSPWLGIALVLAILTLLLAALALLLRLARPHPELVRKLLHVGMGLTTLSFPWLFDAAWPVLTLAGLSVVVLLSLRWVRYLKESMGGVLAGVQRVSLGEVYFPLAVAILFVLFRREREDVPPLLPPLQRGGEGGVMLYCIPILLLTLADATAGIARLRHDYPALSTPYLLALCITKGWLLLFLPYLLAEGVNEQTLWASAVGLLGVAGPALLFYGTQPEIGDCPTDKQRWLRQGVYAGLGSLVGLA